MGLSDDVRDNEETISNLVERIAQFSQATKAHGPEEQCDAINRADLVAAYERSRFLLAMTWGEKLCNPVSARQRLSLDQIRILLAEGRKVRELVEKEIKEMRKIPYEERIAKAK